MSQLNETAEVRVGLYMEPSQLEILKSILMKHLPDRAVWAFGSRARGRRLKRFSDLDLAIAGKLTLAEHAHLASDFDESAMPLKVDIIELDELEVDFLQRIQADFVTIDLDRR